MITATPPLWPEPVVPPPRENAIASCFPALARAAPARAILVVPDGSLYLAYRTLRLLHDAGVAVDLLCPRGHPLTRSRYVRHICEVANWTAAESRVADFLRHAQRPWRQILIAHEPSARRLLASLDEQSLTAWQPGALASPACEFFSSKFGLVAAQAAWDLPIPPTCICSDARELRDFAAHIGGPVIVKPPHQLGGVGIRIFHDARELAAAQDSLRFPLLAQKLITGRRVVLDLLCSRGQLLAWFASYSIAQANGPLSYSTARLFRALPALAPLVEKIAACSRFEGFCGIDCIEEAGTGRHYLLEFNPRLTSGFNSARFCGLNCAPAIAAWVDGILLTSAPLTLPADCETRVHYFPTDLARCVRQRDWRGLQHWLPGTRFRHDWCADDFGVMLAWLRQRLIFSPARK